MVGADVGEAKAVIDRLREAFAALQFDGNEAGRARSGSPALLAQGSAAQWRGR